MGLLSISIILLSLTCLAALMGLALAAIFLWPRKNQDKEANNRTEGYDRPDRKTTDQE